jgi:hypothetical protein
MDEAARAAAAQTKPQRRARATAETRHHGLPDRRHSDKEEPVLKKSQKNDPEGRAKQTDTAASHGGAAEHDRGHCFEGEGGADRHLHIAIGRDIEARSEPAQAAADDESRNLNFTHPYPCEPRPGFRIADSEKVRAERREPNGDKDGAVSQCDDEHRNGCAKDSRSQQIGEACGKAREPGTAERQKNSGPIDSKKTECRHDRGNAAKDHDEGGQTAEHEPRSRAGQRCKHRWRACFEQPSYRDRRKTEHGAD